MPNEKAKKIATGKDFVDAMKEYYKPTQNPTLKNFKFRELTQAQNETFPVFCNRVEKHDTATSVASIRNATQMK